MLLIALQARFFVRHCCSSPLVIEFMSRASLRSVNRIAAGNIRNHGSLSTAISVCSDPSPSSLQKPPKNSRSNPLYHLLPPTQNPSNLVELICSALKHHPKSQLSQLQTELKSILPHLNADEVSRVLRRCQVDSRSALVFFNWAKHELSHKPSTYNYCLIVHILSWSKQFGEAMKLLSELVEFSKDDVFRALILSSKDCNWDPIVFDLLIKAYLKLDRVRLGFMVLVKASELGFAPGVISCNFLIDKLLKMNRISQCWQVYDIMGRMEIHPNVHTFNILTNVLCRDGDADKVNEFLEKMEEEGFDPDIVTYNTLISSYCRKGRLENAFYLYRIMQIRKTAPDLVTNTALISGLCRAGRVDEAHKLFNQMGTNPDIMAYNTLIHSYSKEAKMRLSRLLLLEMIGKGIFPDDFTCKVMIEGYIKSGNLISALNFVVEVRKFGATISNDVYDYLITSLCREDRPFAAKNFLDAILRDGYSPKLTIYNDLVKSLCRNDHITEALELFGKDIEPDVETVRALVESLCRTGRSGHGEKVIEEFEVSPDREMVRALIKGYCREKNVERAEALIRLLVREFRVWDSDCYGELIGVVSEDGDVGKLMEVQDRAMKIGFVPDRVSCKYVVQAMCRASVAQGNLLEG